MENFKEKLEVAFELETPAQFELSPLISVNKSCIQMCERNQSNTYTSQAQMNISEHFHLPYYTLQRPLSIRISLLFCIQDLSSTRRMLTGACSEVMEEWLSLLKKTK